MSITYVTTEGQSTADDLLLVSGQKYLTNSKTKKPYRVDDTDLIPKHKRYKYPPRFHRDSLFDWIARQREAAAQLNTPGSKAAQLVRHYGTRGLYHYSLSAWELGADDETARWLEAPENYEDGAANEKWHRLLNAAFHGQPCKWALHVGRNGRTHAHLLAGEENSIPRPTYHLYTDRRKHVKDGFKDRRRVFAYLCSKMYATPRQVAAFNKAVAAAGSVRNLPQHSGFNNMGIVRSEENTVLHGDLEKVPKVIGLDENTPPMTFPALESWLGSAFGSFDKTVFPPRSSPYPAKAQVNAVT